MNHLFPFSRDFDFEIVYTDSGFVPDVLQVPVGSRVVFRNQSGLQMWVASDPHPTHTDYSQFDAQRGYGPGETFVFTFSDSGTYGFHNHERHDDRGVVRVSDENHPLPDISKTIEAQRATRDRLIAMFDPHDSDSIFTIVDAITSDKALSLNCHDIAHDLGHEAYELYGFSGAMTFNNPKHVEHTLVQYICAGGYMHGIVEQLALNNPDLKSHPSDICANVPDADRASCFHGLGHAFMFSNERDTQKALGDCRAVDTQTDMYRCFEGAWMEFFWGSSVSDERESLGWDPADPIAPCIAAQTDEKPTCFLYSTFGYLRTHIKDYPGAVTMCTTNGLNESDSGFCLKGLGLTMMSKFKGEHLEGSEAYVAGLPDEEKRTYYQGVLGYAHLSGVDEQGLRDACSLFQNDTDICLDVLEEILQK